MFFYKPNIHTSAISYLNETWQNCNAIQAVNKNVISTGRKRCVLNHMYCRQCEWKQLLPLTPINGFHSHLSVCSGDGKFLAGFLVTYHKHCFLFFGFLYHPAKKQKQSGFSSSSSAASTQECVPETNCGLYISQCKSTVLSSSQQLSVGTFAYNLA